MADHADDVLKGAFGLALGLGAFGIVVALLIGLAFLAVVIGLPFVIIAWLFHEQNPFEAKTKVTLFAAVSFITVILYFVADVKLGLFGLVGFGGLGAYWYFNHPWFEAQKRYELAYARYRGLTRMTPKQFRLIEEKLALEQVDNLDMPLIQYMLNLAEVYYEDDYAHRQQEFPAFPPFDIRFERQRMVRLFESIESIIDDASQDVARGTQCEHLAKDLVNVVMDEVGEFTTESGLYIPFYDAVPDVRPLVAKAISYVVGGQYNEVADALRLVIAQNTGKVHDEHGYINTHSHPGTAQEVVRDYLTNTCLVDLFAMPVPSQLTEKLRSEHGVIVAGSGGGKTQLLEALILSDLDNEARPGVILIDSKGEMIERISRLDVFHPEDGALRNQLIVIDHKDKPALNMFDVDEALVNSKINEVSALMRYFFGGLFGSQLSDQMDVLFLPLLHMVLRIKGATLHTFADLVSNPKKYPDILAKIPDGPRNFILNHYDDRGYAQTKTAIVTRLFRIINEVTLDEMFSAPRNAVNIAEALNEGKIVLVSTDADGLQDLSPILGKYFIAQVMNAGLSRGSRQTAKRRPVHFYIDECAPYVDDKLAQMLTTIRSYGIGVMMAFQGEWQMKAYTQVILGNTAIKLVGSATEADARAFASDMGTDPEFIQAQRKGHGFGRFACYTRDLHRAVSVQVPFGQLDEREPMDDAAYQHLRALNQVRVSVIGVRPGAEPSAGADPFTERGAFEQSPPPVVYVPGQNRKKRQSPKSPKDFTALSDEL